MKVPLLIGGATTSRVHTAVKIDPNYRSGPVVHVNDASRAVGVASALLSPDRREAYAAEVRAEYAKISAAHFRAQADKKRLKLADARANAVHDRFRQDAADQAGVPRHQDFHRLRSRRARRLHRLDAVLPDLGIGRAFSRHSRRSQGRRSRALALRRRAQDARAIVEEKWFKAQATIGFWPANADGDDIAVYADEAREEADRDLPHAAPAAGEARRPLQRRAVGFHRAGLRPACRIISAPSWSPPGSARTSIADRFKNANDDYSSILCKALADRLAEAFAERMHARVRREFWGYAPDENAVARRLILEQYRRHPSRARLSRAARSHREGDAVRAARRREHRRREADRELCDVAGLVGVGALFQPSRKPSISASARSSATRSRTTPRARAGASRKPSAGWRRC